MIGLYRFCERSEQKHARKIGKEEKKERERRERREKEGKRRKEEEKRKGKKIILYEKVVRYKTLRVKSRRW